MPLSLLVQKLKSRVPTDSSLFLPEFTTTNSRSKHALYSMWCEMCSPYYNYMMLACGFPAIDVQGEKSDYEMILEKWLLLKNHFVKEFDFMERVGFVIKNIVDNFDDSIFWNKMFMFERCGSGSDICLQGWWTDLYKKIPSVRYPGNFSTHVSKVPYKQLNTGKNYEMRNGLFFSTMKGDFLEPQFAFLVQEKSPEPISSV